MNKRLVIISIFFFGTIAIVITYGRFSKHLPFNTALNLITQNEPNPLSIEYMWRREYPYEGDNHNFEISLFLKGV